MKSAEDIKSRWRTTNMKSPEDIKSEIQQVEAKLAEHEANYERFGWAPGVPGYENAEKTKAYMMGWINALKDILGE